MPFRQDVHPAYGEALGCHPSQGVIGVLPPGAVGSDLGSPVEIVVAEVGVLPDTSCKLGFLGYLIFLGIGVLYPAGVAAPVFGKFGQQPGKVIEILGFAAGSGVDDCGEGALAHPGSGHSRGLELV